MDFRSVMTVCAGLVLLAAPAFAGPTWTFGPEDQGQLKLEYKGQFQLNLRDSGAEADGEGSAAEFNFRRNRLALMGAYDNLGLYVQTEYSEDVNIGPLDVGDGNGNDFRLLDAVVRFRFAEPFNLWVGKYKYSFSRENLEACEMPLTLDRSLLLRAPLASEGTRDKGMTLWGNLFDRIVQYRLDVMNGRNDSDASPSSNFRYGARVHATLLDPEAGHGYKGTYLGEKKILTVGAAYQTEQDVAYGDTVALTGAVDYRAWTADLFFEYPLENIGTVTVSGAYADYDLDDAYQGANPDAGVIGLNGEKNGGYVKIGYLLPNLPLQLFARTENWSFANLNNVYSQEVDWYGGGFNYYLRGQELKLTVEYAQIDFDREGTFGGVKTEDFATFTTQLQVIF